MNKAHYNINPSKQKTIKRWYVTWIQGWAVLMSLCNLFSKCDILLIISCLIQQFTFIVLKQSVEQQWSDTLLLQPTKLRVNSFFFFVFNGTKTTFDTLAAKSRGSYLRVHVSLNNPNEIILPTLSLYSSRTPTKLLPLSKAWSWARLMLTSTMSRNTSNVFLSVDSTVVSVVLPKPRNSVLLKVVGPSSPSSSFLTFWRTPKATLR